MAQRFPLLALIILLGLGHHSPANPPPLVPDDISPKTQLLQPGLTLSLVVDHPEIVTPTGIDVDEKGRIWTVASHTHFRPDPYPGPDKDEVLLFEADGSNRRVFYNATVATMDLELGDQGWVYLAERDRILRIRDTDGDEIADQEEDIAVLETTSTYPHNGLSGLSWAPNGDLLFALGENFWKQWTLTGTDGSAVIGTGEGGIFRCSPEGHSLRRVAKGFWNPFGVCVREDGEIFAAENDPGSRPPCRMLHIVEGGDYGYNRRYGNAPVHPFVAWNGELPGTLPMLHPSGEAPCGILPLGGGLIAGSWSDHRVDFYPLTRKGATFTTKRIPLISGSDHFRPTCFAYGPDGKTIYFTDWALTFYHLHQRGRIWKLEISEEDAHWLSFDAEPPNAETLLAAELRRGKPDLPL
ncbi:MAG: PVC-type heme-binding CxxCH protein, partial [Verrucomicrobiota bacterium]